MTNTLIIRPDACALLAYMLAADALRSLVSRGGLLFPGDAADLRYCAGCVIGYRSGPAQAALSERSGVRHD